MLRDDAVETVATKTFAELGLPEPLLRELAAAGIDKPFPIQSATIPDALDTVRSRTTNPPLPRRTKSRSKETR